MIDPDSPPSPNDPPERHADFLELSALRSPAQGISIYSHIRDLRLASANEVVADSEESDQIEEGDDQSEAIAEAAFDECDDRRRSCGADSSRYPFDVRDNTLRLCAGADRSLYAFLGLLSWFGKDAGPTGTNGGKLFEEICAKAAERYLGSPHSHVRSFVFGFPRRLQPAGFAAALDKLCCELGEGQGHHRGRATLPRQKDGKLDIVTWRAFEDQREGKLIAFGQCATGNDWESKISELPEPYRWCSQWMAESPVVDPVRSFFVPHRVARADWPSKCRFGGILYDRCRIASLASDCGDPDLEREWIAWSDYVLRSIRGHAA